MIFATVGTQLPFPRLLAYLSEIAPSLDQPIVAQTCDPDFASDAFTHRATLAPGEFDTLFADAAVIVGHAGIGTILTARRLEKPLIVVPRRGALGEHRNDHQMATAASVADFDGIHVAYDATSLAALLSRPDLTAAREVARPERSRLIDAVRAAIGDR